MLKQTHFVKVFGFAETYKVFFTSEADAIAFMRSKAERCELFEIV
jgi:hypothetical protein